MISENSLNFLLQSKVVEVERVGCEGFNSLKEDDVIEPIDLHKDWFTVDEILELAGTGNEEEEGRE